MREGESRAAREKTSSCALLFSFSPRFFLSHDSPSPTPCSLPSGAADGRGACPWRGRGPAWTCRSLGEREREKSARERRKTHADPPPSSSPLTWVANHQDAHRLHGIRLRGQAGGRGGEGGKHGTGVGEAASPGGAGVVREKGRGARRRPPERANTMRPPVFTRFFSPFRFRLATRSRRTRRTHIALLLATRDRPRSLPFLGKHQPGLLVRTHTQSPTANKR